MATLVERLNEHAARYARLDGGNHDYGTPGMLAADLREAADRIAALEEALRLAEAKAVMWEAQYRSTPDQTIRDLLAQLVATYRALMPADRYDPDLDLRVLAALDVSANTAAAQVKGGER